MPKEKKETRETKEDKVVALLSKGVYEIFDATPRGSIVSGEVHKLAKELIKLLK